MVFIATYVAIVSFIDARVEERRFFSILKYIVGALAAIPILYALYKVRILYKHPLLLLKYLFIATADVVNISIFDDLYYRYLKELSKDIMAPRISLMGCKKGRIEYLDLTGYQLLTFEGDKEEEQDVYSEFEMRTESTKFVVNSTVWDLIAYLLKQRSYHDNLHEFIMFYLKRIHVQKSTDVGNDYYLRDKLSQLASGTRIDNLSTLEEYASFMENLMRELFTVNNSSSNACINECIRSLGTVYGSLGSYIDIRLEDRLDRIVLNGELTRLGEGEFISFEPNHYDRAARRIVIQRNITDWHLFYMAVHDVEDVNMLLEKLPSKENNYEGKLVTENGGVYHTLSHREFVNTFSLRHRETTERYSYSDTIVYFDQDEFKMQTTVFRNTYVVLKYKVKPLDGTSGWLA